MRGGEGVRAAWTTGGSPAWTGCGEQRQENGAFENGGPRFYGCGLELVAENLCLISVTAIMISVGRGSSSSPSSALMACHRGSIDSARPVASRMSLTRGPWPAATARIKELSQTGYLLFLRIAPGYAQGVFELGPALPSIRLDRPGHWRASATHPGFLGPIPQHVGHAQGLREDARCRSGGG